MFNNEHYEAASKRVMNLCADYIFEHNSKAYANFGPGLWVIQFTPESLDQFVDETSLYKPFYISKHAIPSFRVPVSKIVEISDGYDPNERGYFLQQTIADSNRIHTTFMQYTYVGNE